MILQTTLALAAAAVAINFWLFLRVIQVRMARSVMHGDGGDPLLLQRMRAQANFIEHAPIFLILVALIELAHKGGAWLPIVGAVFMLGRVAHVLGMDRGGRNLGRGGGILLTLITEIGLAVVALLIALGRF